MRFLLSALVLQVVLMSIACKDAGSDPPPAPVVTAVQPATAAAGDTVRITGTGFGVTRGTSSASVGSVPFTVFTAWGGTEIRAVVPSSAQTGNVVVTVEGRQSNGVLLTIGSDTAGAVSFSGDVQPILATGCALSGCHQPPSPASGFDQSTFAGVRAGGSKYGTSVVIPGDSANSRIIQAMRGTAPGLGRMPFGGPWASTGVPEENIRTIARWIQEGALNN